MDIVNFIYDDILMPTESTESCCNHAEYLAQVYERLRPKPMVLLDLDALFSSPQDIICDTEDLPPAFVAQIQSQWQCPTTAMMNNIRDAVETKIKGLKSFSSFL